MTITTRPRPIPPNLWKACPQVALHCGEAMELMRSLPTASVDAVVTDPPYSSGGMMRGDRVLRTSDKYVLAGTALQRPDFHGDNRDQRSWTHWCETWMTECLRIVRPGGYLMAFTDWRQLPSMSDAIQSAGWVWRGQVAWDKTEAARPQKGWFRTGQLEYVMLASSGPMLPEQQRPGPCLGGVWREAVNARTKHHITGKPVGLMRWLLGVLPAGAVVLDPFAGSGSTLLAARELGMRAIGCELSPAICQTAGDRLAQFTLPL